jgi:excisionase family DNA binding protein
MEVKKICLSLREASRVSGLPLSTLYKLSAKRELPLVKFGRRVLVPVEEFEKFLLLRKIDNKGQQLEKGGTR